MNKYVYLNFSKRHGYVHTDKCQHFPNFMYDVENRILQKPNSQILDLLKKISRIGYPRNF